MTKQQHAQLQSDSNIRQHINAMQQLIQDHDYSDMSEEGKTKLYNHATRVREEIDMQLCLELDQQNSES